VERSDTFEVICEGEGSHDMPPPAETNLNLICSSLRGGLLRRRKPVPHCGISAQQHPPMRGLGSLVGRHRGRSAGRVRAGWLQAPPGAARIQAEHGCGGSRVNRHVAPVPWSKSSWASAPAERWDDRESQRAPGPAVCAFHPQCGG
jgi:hypothetical protein